MGSPTVVEVVNVEASCRFLHACGLATTGSSAEEGLDDSPLRLLENACGSTGVLLVPKSLGLGLGTGLGATITIPIEDVRGAATSALRSGARLSRSHRVPPPPAPSRNGNNGRHNSRAATEHCRDLLNGGEATRAAGRDIDSIVRRSDRLDRNRDAAARASPRQGADAVGVEAADAGIACVAGPDGLRVLFVDRCLLDWKPRRGGGGRSMTQQHPLLSGLASLASLNAKRFSSSPSSLSTEDIVEPELTAVDPASLYSADTTTSAARENQNIDRRCSGQSSLINRRLGTSNDWFSEADLLGSRKAQRGRGDNYPASPVVVAAVAGGNEPASGSRDQNVVSSRNDAGGNRSRGGSRSRGIGFPSSVLDNTQMVDPGSSDYGRPGDDDTDGPVVGSSVGVGGKEPKGQEGKEMEENQLRGRGGGGDRSGGGGSFGSGGRSVDSQQEKGKNTTHSAAREMVTAESSDPAHKGKGEKYVLRKGSAESALGRGERPFRQLEVLMLGNVGGTLLSKPNTISPIPIDNEFFTGDALLVIKREPMDQEYAHMFEGKNRMFEVQVQGTFKKIPLGDMYVSLEITEKMKLGLLTKGLCKVLLSFGQRLNKRLHYSFGTDDNSEMPHIAFPLISSVDSLIVTANGEEPPLLGKPFMESKESKMKRKNIDTAGGFGAYEMGYTYSFSFHSMYVDIANWSTCKIPIMSDMDLHTFWGNASLRIAAYTLKPSPSSRGYRAHLQPELDYVFCVQIRHLSQEEQRQQAEIAEAEEAQAEALEQANSNTQDEDEEMITQPLLTDRDELSPRGRQVSASFWTDNDDPSDGEGREANARPRQPSQGKNNMEEDDSEGSEEADDGIDGSNDQARRNQAENYHQRPDTATSTSTMTSWPETRHLLDHQRRASAPSYSSSSSPLPLVEKRLPGDGTQTVPPFTADSSSRAGGGRGGGGGIDNRCGAGAGAAGGGSWTSQMKPSPDGQRIFRREYSHGALLEEEAGQGAGEGRGDRGWTATTMAAGQEERPLEEQQWEDEEDDMLRCPAYVDLYARSPKLQGTWTAFIVVRRGGRSAAGNCGKFWLRSPKNLSILPSNLVSNVEYSPRLSRREAKRRKLDAALQLLTAPIHADENRAHQVALRALVGMESSADRAFRAHNPAPPPASATRRSQTGLRSFASDIPAEGTMLPQLTAPRDEAPAASDGKEPVINGQRSTSVYPVPSDSPPESPALSSARSDASNPSSGKGGSSHVRGITRRTSKSWGSGRSLAGRKEGMVLRALSEHHLSQQQVVLLPSSLTFSRPRKQCLRLSTMDIVEVRVAMSAGGRRSTISRAVGKCYSGSSSRCSGRDKEVGKDQQMEACDHDSSSHFIPGMYPIEIHTVGRVHYMLVEGLEEAVAWADAIEAMASDDGRTSPQGEVCLSDPFSQYLTKKQCWKASNLWVLNCRRMELSAEPDDGGWIAGCWWDGDVGGEGCKSVEGLLRQALELNEDSRREQLITFLDSVCKLRWMPLEGLAHSEQLALFLNLYHVMLLHAYFLLGPPGSPLRVASYFTILCYEIGGDLISMAELEHRILRAKTSLPKQFLSKLIIPTTDYSFALRQPEARVSFALNCGSISAVPCVAIYSPATVEKQIEEMSIYYMQSTTEVHVAKRTVILPKIVSWYSEDFNSSSSSSSGTSAASSGSAAGCLLGVKRYLTGEKRRQMEQLLSDGGNVNVKFSTWSWRCRPVTLVDEAELEHLRHV